MNLDSCARSRKPRIEQFGDEDQSVHCSIYIFEDGKPTPSQVFRECARQYWIQTSNKSFAEVCDHNANVAWNLGQVQVSTTWRIMKLLFGFSGEVAAVTNANASRPNVGREDSEPNDSAKDSSRPGTRHQSGSLVCPAQAETPCPTIPNGTGPNINAPASSNERGVSDTSGGVSEEAESEVEDLESQVLLIEAYLHL